MNIIKSMLILLGGTLLIWFALPVAFFKILNSGNVVGLIISAVMIIYGIWFKGINSGFAKLWQTMAGKIILCTAIVLIMIITVFVLFSTVKMIYSANDKPEGETTVVVLGCQVHPWGPSLMLEERLNAAYEYLSENENIKCILSGGQGDDEIMSEAECMYNWLADKGIKKERMYIEDRSGTTRENLEFSKAIMEREDLCPVITIITNDFHQYRASMIAKSLGIECYNVSGRTFKTMLPTYYVRELGGILYEIFVEK